LDGIATTDGGRGREGERTISSGERIPNWISVITWRRRSRRRNRQQRRGESEYMRSGLTLTGAEEWENPCPRGILKGGRWRRRKRRRRRWLVWVEVD